MGTATKPVWYSVLEKATQSFDKRPLASGGHWLGKGGFAEVYYCKLAFGGREEQEVAVKVFTNKVWFSSYILISFSVTLLTFPLLRTAPIQGSSLKRNYKYWQCEWRKQSCSSHCNFCYAYNLSLQTACNILTFCLSWAIAVTARHCVWYTHSCPTVP